MSIGSNARRVDAVEKVMGRARFTADLCPEQALVAKVVRSTIASGRVLAFDLEEAQAVPGVVRILTCFDAPKHLFPTAGHPWSVDPAHQDVADRRLLNEVVHVYGDDIAVVVARDEVAAVRAARLVKVRYEEYPVYTAPAAALADGAHVIHPELRESNLLAHHGFKLGDTSWEDAAATPGAQVFEGHFSTQAVQHCHMEVPVSFAYMEKGRIVVTSSTQIPHIVRRVIGQALGIPWGKVRVIKPYIGGGFGNKQDVLYEPLNAWLTTQVGGQVVRLELTREETMANTRVRHAMEFDLATVMSADGRMLARRMVVYSNQGGYASHGHAVVGNSLSGYLHNYDAQMTTEGQAYTVYTNLTAAGAMRGYGIPQVVFAMEAHLDDICQAMGLDPCAVRLQNCMRPGYVDPYNGITCHSYGLTDCIQRGIELSGWTEKRKAYAGQTGPIRRGIGMALFSYKAGVHPISLELACCRMVLNQDGSAQLQVGATEIGQGSDTVLTQMAAASCGLREEDIHIISMQDTDVTPFDLGAYASRQTYVSGMAVKQTAERFKERMLTFAAGMQDCTPEQLDIRCGEVVDSRTGAHVMPVSELALNALYSLEHAVHITAEESVHCKDNTYSFGVCFAEVEVDIPVGKVKVLRILNVHDSGVIINPQLAQAQVHGGMSMGLGFGLGEVMLYDERARPLNANLLDYKLPTAADTPELETHFVDVCDPSGPYGNKSLGEPPAIPPAPAIRNAVLHATGVRLDSLPMSPQKLTERFMEAGLIAEGGAQHV